MSAVRKLATKCKGMVRRFHGKLKRIQSEINSPDKKLISLKPAGTARGNVLISHKIQLFLTRPGQPIPYFHNSTRLSRILAQTFLDLGYSVDVISNNNRKFLPKKEYAFFIDTRMNMERLSLRLNKNCVKILFLTTGHAYFQTAAEATRLLAVQERKHVTLRGRRFMPPEHAMAIEYADCLIDRSEFVKSNFRYANKPFYRIPNATPIVLPLARGKRL